MSAAVLDYLHKLGFPGDWKHADRAIKVIEQHGFVVSPAAELMIRQFGGFDTSKKRPLRITELDGVMHGPSHIEVNPFGACLSREEVDEMEAFHGVQGLCPIGCDLSGVGVMCITPMGHVYFEESSWAYAGTPTEVIVRLLAGTPNL